jgi:hypothetical protein
VSNEKTPSMTSGSWRWNIQQLTYKVLIQDSSFCLIVISNVVLMSVVNYEFVKSTSQFIGDVNIITAISAGVSIFKGAVQYT